MSQFLYSVDISEIEFTDEVVFHYEGWTYTPGIEHFTLKVLGDEKNELPISLTFRERPDIIPVLTGAVLPPKPGFAIFIKNIEEYLHQYRKIGLYFCSDAENRLLSESESSDILKTVAEKMMKYNVDSVDIKSQRLVIQGWAVDLSKQKKLDIELKDASGGLLPCKISRTIRSDVNTLYNMSEIPDYGFHISLKMEKCPEDHAFICFSSEPGVALEYDIDLKKLRYEKSPKGRRKAALQDKEKNRAFIREHGRRAFRQYLEIISHGEDESYALWRINHTPGENVLREQRSRSFKIAPLISIVIPLYNTPIKYFRELIKSITDQTYQRFEICLADGSTDSTVEKYVKRAYGKDSRIKYKRVENRGISANTNEAVKMASGDYIMFADHDDLIAAEALYEIVSVINETDGRAGLIYTDEDKITMEGDAYFEPAFKPDFNIDLLRSDNYICHITVVKKTLLEEAGLLRPEYDGAQDHDFVLRCAEKTDEIYHIPKVLYHWRSHPNSTSEDPESKRYAFEAGKNAVRDHYRRIGIEAEVEDANPMYPGFYRSRFVIKGDPKISIIIPNKDHIDDLDKCIRSVISRSSYRNWEIIIAENNSEEPETFRYYEELQKTDERIRVITWEGTFNYSAINNFAVSFAEGEYLLLLNNDIEVITENWMEEMLGYCQRDDVGIVGAKLYYPDHTIQHAGVILGLGGIAGHIHSGAGKDSPGYLAKLITAQDLSAVTAACMMVPRELYLQAGGMDEAYAVAFNDVDFCMKVRALGKLIVFTPYAELFHYESKSRGMEDTPEKQMRFLGEIRRFENKWKEVLEKGDPYYSPNLTLDKGDCSLSEQ